MRTTLDLPETLLAEVVRVSPKKIKTAVSSDALEVIDE